MIPTVFQTRFFEASARALLVGLLLDCGGAAFAVTPPVDLDGDGLGDFWQVKHGIIAANAGLDNDGDGYTAEEEHDFGTDSGDGESRLAPEVESLSPQSR